MLLLRRVLTVLALTSLIVIALAFLFGHRSPPKQSHYGADVTVHTKLAAPAPETVGSPLATTANVSAETPAAPKATCDTHQNVYCYGVYGRDQYGTPIPKVQTTQPAEPWIRSDGYFNYCYRMTDGSWTTVIGKLDIQPGVYYYGGLIDQDTQAPAYADQSQAWCAAHVPAVN